MNLMWGVIGMLCVPWLPAGAVPSWPGLDSGWNTVTIGGSMYVDARTNDAWDNRGTPPQSPVDIVGGIDQNGKGPFAAGFWAQTAEELMFRMRVDTNPSVGGQFVWTALLNTDGDSDVDWAVQLDLSGDNQVELVQALSGGPANGWDVTLAGTPHSIGFEDGTYWRFVEVSGTLDPPYTGSQFYGPGPANGDWFVDIAIPLATFHATTGWNSGDPLGIAFSTSSTHTLDNKDRPDDSDWAEIPLIPAPGALILGSLGACVVGRLRRGRLL
jgi:hypothetical protein